MRHPVRTLVAAAVLLGMAACQASRAPSAAHFLEPIPTPAAAPTSPSPMSLQTCDPLDEVFANMFVGLSGAALANAGIEPEEFFTALAGDRAILEHYLEALGIPVDDAWIDGGMSANLGQRLVRDRLDAGASPSAEGEWLVCE